MGCWDVTVFGFLGMAVMCNPPKEIGDESGLGIGLFDGIPMALLRPAYDDVVYAAIEREPSVGAVRTQSSPKACSAKTGLCRSFRFLQLAFASSPSPVGRGHGLSLETMRCSAKLVRRDRGTCKAFC